MNKKNKIIAITLGIVLGVGAMTGAGFAIFSATNKVKGTQAARILLARENMGDGSEKLEWDEMLQEETLNQHKQSYNLSNTLSTNNIDLGDLVHDSPAGKVYKKGNEYNFQSISGASNQGLVVESRLKNIEFRVEQAAENINYLKNELNIVNKWVKDGFSKYYLDVDSNCETLIEYYEDNTNQKSLWVVQRETKDNSNSVYTIMHTDIGTGKVNNPVLLSYTPNERYEYYYGHDGNARDYLIAEQDKGYWNIFMPNDDDYYNVTVSDEFAFESFGNYAGVNDNYGGIITTDLKEDVIYNYENGITIHLSAFEGIKGIFAPEDITHMYTYDGGEKTYYTFENSFRNQIEIRLDNGNILKNGDLFTYGEKVVEISGLNMEFFTNPGFADPQYDVSFNLEMGNLSLKQKIELLNDFLIDNDLNCKYDLDKIEKSIVKNSEIASTLTSYYMWNGYLINSSDNFSSAEGVMLAQIENLFAEYEKVKDAEVVGKFLAAKVAKNQKFGKIENISMENATYSDKKISISNISLIAKKSDLLEEDEKYRLQVGLARIDKNGQYLSQNTVNLKTNDNISSIAYSKADMSLNITGTFDVPTALQEGKYVVVVYVVTDKEGIRVSEMKSIGFVDTVNETIETVATNIKVNTENNNLYILYTTKLNFEISLDGEVTYSSLRRAMMTQVLMHGYPQYDEEIKNSAGVNISENTEIISGIYKLKFVVPTIDGDVTGYVTCVVS